MNLRIASNWKSVAAILLIAAALPTFAQKRRAVAHPGPAGPSTAIILTGTVLDAVTGQPVIFADVRLGARSDRTDRFGKFRIGTTIFGSGTVTASRSGYTAVSQTITGGGTQDVTIRLQPTPTVRLRLVNGTTHDIDLESVEFGYVPPFGSYHKGESDDFCKANGQTATINRTDFSRITGPATLENFSTCCDKPVLKINAQLKNGENGPLYFSDSCIGYTVDFIGRDHVSGQFVYAKFTDIAEIIFP